MTPSEEKVLAGIAALLTLLIVGAVFGRLHGSDGPGLKPVGDRVACGLFAVPLITVCVRLAFPATHVAWAILAPCPLLVYVVLLACTDLGCETIKKWFTCALLAGVGVTYVIMGILWRCSA